MICMLCDGEIQQGHLIARANVLTNDGLETAAAHAECTFRSVIGGIGHHMNHDYWCGEMKDPDAGLSYRESAQRVWQLFRMDHRAER